MFGLSDKVLNISLLGDITGNRQALDLLSRPLRFLFGQIGNDDACAFCSKADRHGFADTARAAGDGDCLVF